MASDSQILLASLQGLFGLVDKKIQSDLAKYEVDAKIKATKDAANLSFERKKHVNDINNRTTILNAEYNNQLEEVQKKHAAVSSLGLLEDEYVKKIADSADGTVDGISILKDLKSTTLDDFKITVDEVENTGNLLNDLEVAKNKNIQVINVLDNMLADAGPAIALANRVKETAVQDFNYINDNLGNSTLIPIFNETFKDYQVDSSGNFVLDGDGNPTKIFNEKFQAFKNSLPSLEQKMEFQTKLNTGLKLLDTQKKDVIKEEKEKIKAINKEKEENIKTGDKNVDEMWKGISNYIGGGLLELPDVNSSTIEAYQDAGYYFDVTLHDFSQEKQHLSLGGGRYQSMDFIIGLETKIENAIIGLIEGGIEDQETSDHLLDLYEKRDVQGIIDYLIVPKEGQWSLDGNLSGNEKSKDKGGHHPRMASMDFQDLIMADVSTPEGKRSNWSEDWQAKRNASFTYDGDRDEAWEDVDLIYGSGDISSRYAAEEALIKYADMYTMIQNTKTWKKVWDQQKELPVFKNNPEAWQMFQRDIANQWAQDLFPINFDTFEDLTNSLQETFDKNALAYGHKPSASLTNEQALDHLRGEDSRPTFEEAVRSGEFNQFEIADTLVDTIDDSVVTTILNPELGQSLDYISNLAEKRYLISEIIGDDIGQDALYSGDANSDQAKSIMKDDRFLDLMKTSDKISYLGLFMELEGGLSPSQVTEHFEFYGYLPAENKREIMKEVVKQRSKAEMVTTFTTMLADIYERIGETAPETYNAIRTRIGMDFDNSYDDTSNDFINEVLKRGNRSKPSPKIEMVPIK